MTEPEEAPAPSFASRSVGVHLARGVGAVALGALALHSHDAYPLLTLAALSGAVVLLRGCPMCWTLGLIEAVLRAKTCAPCAAANAPERRRR